MNFPWAAKKKKYVAPKATQVPIPDKLRVHETPESAAHYETAPHPGCECRVCELKTEIEQLKAILTAATKEKDGESQH